MNRRKMFYLALATVILVAGSFVWNLTARAAYETAEYTVVEKDGPFEIRDYPDLMLASTAMRLESQGSDGSFMRLFRYISGANDANQKVAMTTPVFMEGSGEDAKGNMGFVIPKEVASEGVPQPTSADVQVRRREAGRFAVIRFAGRMDAKAAEKAEKQLRDWVLAKGLRCDREAEAAGYDPPWTPGPLRRNEILVRLGQ